MGKKKSIYFTLKLGILLYFYIALFSEKRSIQSKNGEYHRDLIIIKRL